MIPHKILKIILHTLRIHEFKIIDEPPKIQGNCIYAINHSCKWDFQYMVELLPKFTVLAGKQRLGILDRIAFIWNGVIWVDRKDKKGKADAKKKMYKLLEQGKNLCIFSEGTWNLEASRPVLPMYWGIIELAQKGNVPIVPICLEYYKEYVVVKYGEIVNVEMTDNKAEAIQRLRDIFATLKWDIWEMNSLECRKDIEQDCWEKEVKRRLLEYSKFDYEYEMSCILKNDLQ